MVRFKGILMILREAEPVTDFWMYTSGIRLGLEQSQQLKEVGLTGILVSLDHHIADEHDRFRGFSGAYLAAIRAVLAAKEAKLVTGLALCATSDFTTEDNFRAYMVLARKLGVSFVQILEPKEAGKYLGLNVQLHENKVNLLERLASQYNRDKRFADFPIINYPESVIRKVGCLAGDRIVYINSLGMVQQCPFCDQTYGRALDLPVGDTISRVTESSCSSHEMATL